MALIPPASSLVKRQRLPGFTLPLRGAAAAAMTPLLFLFRPISSFASLRDAVCLDILISRHLTPASPGAADLLLAACALAILFFAFHALRLPRWLGGWRFSRAVPLR